MSTAPKMDDNHMSVDNNNNITNITITRRINVRIQGSLSEFSQDGQGGASWRSVDGKQASIWGLQDSSFIQSNGIAPSTSSNTHSLNNAVIKNARLIEQKSTFMVPLGVTINCLPSNETTNFGEAYCYTVLPESNNTVPLSLFEASDESEEGVRWRKEYPKYNHSNLEKMDVLEASDCAYLFVHQKHPVIALLRANRDLIGNDIDKQQKIDNEWYKVQKETFAACCTAIRQKILSKVPTKNLNDFTLELHRIGAKEWMDSQDKEDALSFFQCPVGVSAQERAKLEAAHMANFYEKRCFYYARLEVTFEIPQ